MADLKELLDISNLNETEIPDRFKKIAKQLMCNYIISKKALINGRVEEKRYAIVEIEFYLFSKEHPDYITYPRKMEAGRWFFHPSGVDLTFDTLGDPKKDKNKKGKECFNYKDCSFGGILIRGIYLIDKEFDKQVIKRDNYIFGPRKCVDILWDDFNAFKNSDNEYPIICKAHEKEKKILNLHSLRNCKRCINIENKKEKVNEWIERIVVNTEFYNEDSDTYCNELFNFNEKYIYRFFNLPVSINPSDFTKIPKDARPKTEEIHEVK